MQNSASFMDNGKEQPKVVKNGETSGKEKALAILMVQPWERVDRQRITQSFSPNPEILFPPLGEDEGTKGPMIIEAEIRGHCVHRMYVDGGSASEILAVVGAWLSVNRTTKDKKAKDTIKYTSTPPVDSFIMEDEHLDTIPAKKSDEVIKSSVENLVQIPKEFEGIPDKMCDEPFRDNPPPLNISKDQFEGFSNSNDGSTLIDDDSFSIDDIDYVEASPLDSELVSLEVVEIVIPEVERIDIDILLTIKDDILHEKLLNVNLLIAKIEALKDNPTPSSDFVTKSSSTSLNFFLAETNTFDNSLPESETF
ncbi:hypothetical protein Tco_1398705 [Tanacetum coccineum]